MIRNSEWKITWEPDAITPLVLMDYDDLMDSEIRLPASQLIDRPRSDFALRSISISRSNTKRRVEFTVRIPRDTAVLTWRDCFDRMEAAPWNAKGTLRIQPRGGTARNYTAALLSTRHRPVYEDGYCESVHDYAFRVIPI